MDLTSVRLQLAEEGQASANIASSNSKPPSHFQPAHVPRSPSSPANSHNNNTQRSSSLSNVAASDGDNEEEEEGDVASATSPASFGTGSPSGRNTDNFATMPQKNEKYNGNEKQKGKQKQKQGVPESPTHSMSGRGTGFMSATVEPVSSHGSAASSFGDKTLLTQTKSRNITSFRSKEPPKNLSEVLWNKRNFPYDRETFRQFLSQNFAEENLAFWVAVVDYKQQYENYKGPGGEKVYMDESRLSTNSDQVTQLDAAFVVVDTFIREGGAEEINISAREKKNILKEVERAEKENERPPKKGVFDMAQREVERIMEGRFRDFLNSVASQNLSDSEANFRTFGGVILLLLVAALHFSLRYAAGADRFAVSAGTAFPFGVVVYLIISSRNKLCSSRALQGTRMDTTASCFKARKIQRWIDLFMPQKHLCAARSCDQGILDEYALAKLKRAGQRQIALVALVTAIVVVGLGALPPYDDLEDKGIA